MAVAIYGAFNSGPLVLFAAGAPRASIWGRQPLADRLPAAGNVLTNWCQACCRCSATKAPSTRPSRLATLLARYDRFRDDAGTTDLVTGSNRQPERAAAA